MIFLQRVKSVAEIYFDHISNILVSPQLPVNTPIFDE